MTRDGSGGGGVQLLVAWNEHGMVVCAAGVRDEATRRERRGLLVRVDMDNPRGLTEPGRWPFPRLLKDRSAGRVEVFACGELPAPGARRPASSVCGLSERSSEVAMKHLGEDVTSIGDHHHAMCVCHDDEAT